MAAPLVERRGYTAAELCKLSEAGGRYELVKGELREMPPAGEEHGFGGMRLPVHFGSYVYTHGLGEVALAETGFLVARDPDTVLAPDMAFIAKDRLPREFSRRFSEIVPDLVLEVASPGDSWSEVNEKAEQWLAAGVRLVWVLDPRGRRVAVYRSLQEVRILTEAETLDGGDVAPGFSLPVAQIFA